jgi:hypothetical protein
MTQTTNSGKLNRSIEKAQALGLEVTVEAELDNLFETYHVAIKRPHVEVANAMDWYNNSRAIWITASRYVGDGITARAFRISASSYTGALDTDHTRKLQNRTLPYAIEGLAS